MELARLTAKALGVEDLRIAEYPGAVGVHLDEIRRNVKEVVFDQIIDGLTTQGAMPDSTARSSPMNPREIVVSGTLDQINEFFRDEGWGDGLPVIPPTRERVEEFLRYTDRSPDEVIAVLPQANLNATPWNIAANAVMAGCRPEHLPLIIAATEAIADEGYNLNNIGTTWGVFPYLLVNGPLIKELGIEYAGQLISKGPNPSIGRALGLIVRNIAGYRPGRNYMGTFGYPLAFALAEDEEETPWEPFHVEHGFDRTASTVTAGATVTWGWPPSPYSTADKSAAQSTLELLSLEITKKPCLSRLAERGPDGMRNMMMFLLSPSIARSLGDAGYSKQDVREYLCEHARIPLRELEWHTRYGHPESVTVTQKVDAGIYPEEYLVKPDDMIRVLPGPELIHIAVCGDPDRNRLMTLWGGYVHPTTREIQLPARWHEMRAG
jgi:hypothetical protein